MPSFGWQSTESSFSTAADTAEPANEQAIGTPQRLERLNRSELLGFAGVSNLEGVNAFSWDACGCARFADEAVVDVTKEGASVFDGVNKGLKEAVLWRGRCDQCEPANHNSAAPNPNPQPRI